MIVVRPRFCRKLFVFYKSGVESDLDWFALLTYFDHAVVIPIHISTFYVSVPRC